MAGGNIRLVCPPGALDDSLSVTITLEDPSKYYSLIVQKDLENDVFIAAPIVNLQPKGHSFGKPMKLTTTFKHMKWKWNGDDVSFCMALNLEMERSPGKTSLRVQRLMRQPEKSRLN